MRPDIFNAVAPVCPRCLHQEGIPSAITIATREEMRGDHLWHGILHCTNQACWQEFPVIDGVPVIVPDPSSVLKSQFSNLFWRHDLPEQLESLLGDAFGPGDAFDTMRYHLSLYAADHYAGWGLPGNSGVVDLINWGLAQLREANPEKSEGIGLDLGGAVGRGGWELAAQKHDPVVVADLNLSMLRFGQRLALEGQAEIALRRVGIIYDRMKIEVPEALAKHTPDFWAVDAAALPLNSHAIATVTAINLVDCAASPSGIISEIGRVLGTDGGAVLATPHDWSAQATDVTQWLGGHSQRGPHGGAPEPILSAALESVGIKTVAEAEDLSWRLRLHARSVMEYSVHGVAGHRFEEAPCCGPFS